MTDGNYIDWEGLGASLAAVEREEALTPLEGLPLASEPVQLYKELEDRIGEIEAGDLSTVIAQLMLELTHTQLKLLVGFHQNVRASIAQGAVPVQAIRQELFDQTEELEGDPSPFPNVDSRHLSTSLHVVALAYERFYYPRSPLPPEA